MLPDIHKVKGVHPGAILDRELSKRGIKKSAFAMKIGEYPGIITDITKQRRGMNARLSLRIEQELNAREGYFMVLQAYYEVEIAKTNEAKKATSPDLPVIRSILFWDINLDSIDFNKRKKIIIRRIFERGNQDEINEIIRFYGRNECSSAIKSATTLMYSAIHNGMQFLDLNKEDFLCLKNTIGEPTPKPWYRSSKN